MVGHMNATRDPTASCHWYNVIFAFCKALTVSATSRRAPRWWSEETASLPLEVLVQRLGLWDSLNNVTLYPSYWRTAHDRGCPNTWTVSQLDRISFFKLVPSMLYIQWVA
jgi:hypothetical protein